MQRYMKIDCQNTIGQWMYAYSKQTEQSRYQDISQIVQYVPQILSYAKIHHVTEMALSLLLFILVGNLFAYRYISSSSLAISISIFSTST